MGVIVRRPHPCDRVQPAWRYRCFLHRAGWIDGNVCAPSSLVTDPKHAWGSGVRCCSQ
jgi:hypothetical protein